MYIILGGTGFNEGAVLTRERESTLNTWLLDYPTQWFLVEVCCRIDAHHTLTGAQTNYDHWLPPPPVSASVYSILFHPISCTGDVSLGRQPPRPGHRDDEPDHAR